MKILWLKRKWLALALGGMVVCGLVWAVSRPSAVSAFAATKPLPIYCVETDQKACSISFDAAWGAVRVRQARWKDL
ncbi:MAG: hypothetical protein RR350_08945 [Oscillibacter sp.]